MTILRHPMRVVHSLSLIAILLLANQSVTAVSKTRLRSSNNNNTHRRRRNLARGQEWVDQQTTTQSRTKETRKIGDNIFDHNNSNRNDDEGCICDQRRHQRRHQRQRQLGIGACICSDDDYDDDYYNAQKITDPPTVASGKGGSRGNGYNSYGKGAYGKGSSYYSYYSYSTKASKKSSKSHKSDKKKGSKSSKFEHYTGDDDYIYPTRQPTPHPVSGSVPTVQPIRAPHLSTWSPSRSPVGAPTESIPTEAPVEPPPPVFEPTNTGRDDEVSPSPSPSPTPRPTPSKAPIDPIQECSVNAQGLFESNLGLATEFRFLYETQVIPSVTVPELNMDMLPKIEVDMGNELLPRLFPSRCSDSAIATSTTRSVPTSAIRPSLYDEHLEEEEEEEDFQQYGNVFVFTLDDDGGQRNLQSATTSLEGMSIKPRDTVDENEQCQGVDTTAFPCYVVKGSITVFSNTNLSQIERRLIERAIQQTINNGDLVQSDNRFLDITWLRFEEVTPSSPSPNNPPNEKKGLLGLGLDWWMFLLIGLGSFLILLVLILLCCYCRRKRSEEHQRLSPKQSYPDVERNNGDNDSDDSSRSSGSDSDGGESFGRGFRYQQQHKQQQHQSFDDEYIHNRGNPSSTTGGRYFHPSNDQISESLMPSIDEPIEEENPEDISTRSVYQQQQQQQYQTYDSRPTYDRSTGSNSPNYDSGGGGSTGVASFGSRNHLSNVANIYTHGANVEVYKDEAPSPPTSGDLTLISKSGGSLSQPTSLQNLSVSRSGTRSGTHASTMPSGEFLHSSSVDPNNNSSSSNSHSGPSQRGLERNDLEFSYHDQSPQDPDEQQQYQRYEYEEATDEGFDHQPASYYTASMQSELRQSFRSGGDDEGDEEESQSESEYETVEEEYEIEYTSHSERNLEPDSGDGVFEDETWGEDEEDDDEENYPHDNHSSSARSGSNSNSSTPLPFLAHNAQQQKGHKTSFDSLRKKWESSNSSKSRSNSASGGTEADAARSL